MALEFRRGEGGVLRYVRDYWSAAWSEKRWAALIPLYLINGWLAD